MASGFWVVPMTDRAREISAFITPFGLFECSRMPFGLKNAPQIYQRLVDNALYGFLKISPSGDVESTTDVFQTGTADDPDRESVLERRSYIDDIMIAAESWDQMCRRVEDLLEACDKWNLSISMAKSFWGMDKDIRGTECRSEVWGRVRESEGSEIVDRSAIPRITAICAVIPGQLELLSRFIEDYAIYASVFYELREVEFAKLEKQSDLNRILDRNDPISRAHDPPEVKLTRPVDERWIRAHRAFIALKTKIATTPVLRHFDETRMPIVIVYASDWAISASLTQEHDGIYHPVAFASRTLKMNELNYNVSEKEVLALLRILDLYYNLLVGREIRVLTRHSTLACLFKSSGLQGRLDQWSALLAPWILEITKCTKGEDEILGAIAASITPRAKIDDALTDIVPRKDSKRRIQAPIPRDEELWVVSFDGSARVKRGGGAFSAIVWSLSGWEVAMTRSGYLESLTVNEAEYNGLILGLDMLEDLDRRRLVVCGDSNLVIRQVRGEIDCKAPGLTLLKRKAPERPREWWDHELVHVKRDWNRSADSLASAALQHQGGIKVQEGPEYQDLVTLNRLDEILIPKIENPVVRVAAVTTRAGRARSPAGVMEEGLIREIRIDRIKRAQEEEVWIAGMKKYLSGSIADLTQAEARSYGKTATDYESDVLHHYHTTLEGGHQGVRRTYQRIRDHIHWRGLYRSVQRYVGECVDCETGKGKSVIRGESPGNLQATYPFQIIAMDHIPSLPRSHKGNTELLIWVDLFT
ncbi:LOW QUALITY PROTEIN: reverse transcriptase [Phytophthora megakarya]|uniref:Reverse transcriptase n=1 Tax=Phytophthora megakarya TaxID=4795 RepID=A0A225VJZ7_9STRA|nr:LOW QUALITY PROTEIN: reverse transcriptase [Phytophthora megakarya]